MIEGKEKCIIIESSTLKWSVHAKTPKHVTEREKKWHVN